MKRTRPRRQIRAIGFDDGPFTSAMRRVRVVGAVCSATRFEGLVTAHVQRDGWNATEVIERALVGGKFLPQLHLVLLDGLTFGGFNVVDLGRLSSTLHKPCVAMMRHAPDLDAIARALQHLSRGEERMKRLLAAGPVHHRNGFTFQVQGADAFEVADLLPQITDRGNVPEPLRLAHLIAAAIVSGESGRRA